MTVPLTGPRDVVRELTRLRKAGAFKPPQKPMAPGERLDPIRLDSATLRRMGPPAARRALGQTAASRVSEVIWADGGDELAVDPAKLDLTTTAGLVLVAIPVRCDQSASAMVEIAFAVGSPDRPAGLFAAAEQRPRGPSAVVDRWSDALIALAWGTVLEVANSVAATAGRDDSGAVLIPGEIVADDEGLVVVPFARHPLGPLQR